jgi:hypothetical protein
VGAGVACGSFTTTKTTTLGLGVMAAPPPPLPKKTVAPFQVSAALSIELKNFFCLLFDIYC